MTQESIHVVKKRFVRQQRKHLTPAEKRMSTILRTLDIKFVSQKAFLLKYQNKHGKWRWDKQFYIADFWLPVYGTIIEVDGSAHYNQDTKDINRSWDLLKSSNKSINTLLRFTNKDLAYNRKHVIDTIQALQPIRLVHGVKHNKTANKGLNKEIARKNEIASLIKNDTSSQWWKKQEMLEALK